MAATVIIPARYASTRFPAKLLADKTGRPLIQHVVDQVRKCRRVEQIVVAADDQRIADALKKYETHCVLTSPTHQSGTDRIAEVAAHLDTSIIVNVQGDEPEIEPEIIDGLIAHLENSADQMATAATLFSPGTNVSDPNLVKVVMNLDGRALYFSRSAIPCNRDLDEKPAYYLHLGIYAYRRDFLLQFARWEPTPLERSEKLEQLRALEHGSSIYVMKVDRATHGIDTPQQYEQFVKRMKGIASY